MTSLIALTFEISDRDTEERQADPTRAPASYLGRVCDLPAAWARYIRRGWEPHPARHADLVLVPQPGNWFGSYGTTSHSGPYDFLQEVPLVFFGPGFVKNLGILDVDGETTLADVAPTQARVLDFKLEGSKGDALDEVLLSDAQRPKLVVTVVIDGGGWNVLRRWPEAWPNLARLIANGATIRDAVVGTSPSITPAVHSTLGTGSFPRDHGVMAIVMRRDNASIAGAFSTMARFQGGTFANPTLNLDTSTLADQWDAAMKNQPKVAMVAPQNYELGMLGNGAALAGGDKDIAAMLTEDDASWATNRRYFALPAYVNEDVRGPAKDLETVDAADGERDGLWRNHDFFRIDASPAFAPWQSRVVEALVRREGFGDDALTDLLYINFKAPDAAGHRWNMIAPEQRDALVSVDTAIGRMVRFLNHEVGAFNYLLVVTADHGQTPLDSNGWPVFQRELRDDIERRFDRTDDGEPIIERTSTALYFVNKQQAEANGVTPEQIASWMMNYRVSDNAPEENTLRTYDGSPEDFVFAAVIPGRGIDDVVKCSDERK